MIRSDMKKFLCITFYFFLGLLLNGQTAADYDARLNPIQTYQRNNPAYLNQPAQSESQTVEIARSDMGIQRPIEAKKTGFGYHLGFASRLYYSNNPLSADDDGSIDGGGVWENSLNNSFLLGSYDLGGATFSPIIGLSYLNNTNFGTDGHSEFNFDVLNVNFAGVFQIGRTWSLRPNLSFNNYFGDEGFTQFTPSIALSKSFNILSARSFIDWSLGYSFQDNDLLTPTDKNNKFESAWTWGLAIPLGNLEISPYLRFAYLNYNNDDRTDFKTDLGVYFDYTLTEWMKINTFLSYTNNSSDKSSNDFTRTDLGAGTSLTVKF
jgi:hypothetical protein